MRKTFFLVLFPAFAAACQPPATEVTAADHALVSGIVSQGTRVAAFMASPLDTMAAPEAQGVRFTAAGMSCELDPEVENGVARTRLGRCMGREGLFLVTANALDEDGFAKLGVTLHGTYGGVLFTSTQRMEVAGSLDQGPTTPMQGTFSERIDLDYFGTPVTRDTTLRFADLTADLNGCVTSGDVTADGLTQIGDDVEPLRRHLTMGPACNQITVAE
jgi:hypothetical protein